MDSPVSIVDQKAFGVTDEAVCAMQIVAGHGIHAA